MIWYARIVTEKFTHKAGSSPSGSIPVCKEREMEAHNNQVLVDGKVGEILTVEGIPTKIAPQWWFMERTEIGCKPLTLEDGTIPVFTSEEQAHKWLCS